MKKYQSQIYFVVLMRTYLNKRNFFPFPSLTPSMNSCLIPHPCPPPGAAVSF